MNAIFYLLRTGCPWRYLPRGSSRRARRSTTSSAFFPGGGCVGGDLGAAARTAGAGGEPQRLRHREPIAQAGRKMGCARGEADAVGYYGKKVKGRKIHALVDTKRLATAGVGSLRRHSGRGPAPNWFLTASASAFNWGSNLSRPTAATTPAKSNTPSPGSRRWVWRDRQTSRRQFRIYLRSTRS